MGLDMWLFKTDKNENNWDGRTFIGKEHIKDFDELIYWRKANQIRKWIVNNCGYPIDGNVMEYKLTKEDLEKLVNDCKIILDNRDECENIMPTEEGFFFGDTEYDEYYFGDIEYTLHNVEKALSEINFEKEDVFYYEWW